MKVIGITGGMASGKSTLARMLAARGYVHVDADALVHRLMREDHDIIRSIGNAFAGSVTAQGVNRAVLSETIGKNPDALSQLETILHPRVVEEEMKIMETTKRAGGRGVILDIPLLFETGANARCDVVIVAHAPLAVRRERAFARTGMTEEKWNRLIARQLSDAERCARADWVIDTSQSEAETRAQIAALVKTLEQE